MALSLGLRETGGLPGTFTFTAELPEAYRERLVASIEQGLKLSSVLISNRVMFPELQRQRPDMSFTVLTKMLRLNLDQSLSIFSHSILCVLLLCFVFMFFRVTRSPEFSGLARKNYL